MAGCRRVDGRRNRGRGRGTAARQIFAHVQERTYARSQNAEGKSAIISKTATNVQEAPGQFYRATLWTAPGVPVDNSTSLEAANGGIQRDPPPGGFLVRTLEFFPEPDNEKLLARVKESHAKFGQKYPPTEEDMARHPMMHRTDSMDIIFVFQGEVDLITDVDEIRCTPGDCIIVRGTNHAFNVVGPGPCTMMGVMLSAQPLN